MEARDGYGPGDEVTISRLMDMAKVTVVRKILDSDGNERVLFSGSGGFGITTSDRVVAVHYLDSQIMHRGFDLVDLCVLIGPIGGMTVEDAEGNLVEVEFFQDPGGGVFAVDGSFTSQDANPVYNPFSGREVVFKVPAEQKQKLAIFTESHGWVEV